MKILLLSYRGNPYCGGQGIYIYYLARELTRLGHQVQLMVGPPYPRFLDGIPVHSLPNFNFFGRKTSSLLPGNPFQIFSPLHFYEYVATRFSAFPEMNAFSLRSFRKIVELLRYQRFDIIHDNQCLGYGLLLLKTLKIPVIATIHHPLSIDCQIDLEHCLHLKDKIRLLLYYPLLMQRIVAKRLDKIITVSYKSAEDIERYFRVPRKKIKVVYNGIDLDTFKPLEGVTKDPHTLIFVGNTDDRKKGILYLLQAMRMLEKQIKLLVVDGGAIRKNFASRLVREYGLEDRVIFTGNITQDKLVELYAAAQVAIVPSLYEGFGFPAGEAMACGLPVISTWAGALPEIVGKDGRGGILVPPRDASALALQIRKLLGNKKELELMGKRARERIAENFTWEKAGRDISQIYQETIDAYG
jgi:glycosyltransferase involved in cell wall biosynthesis